MQNRESGVFSASASAASSSSPSDDLLGVADLHSLLEQKERDLVLAAELGKALLDKNEELSRQNETIAEEFSQKLEVGMMEGKMDCYNRVGVYWTLRGQWSIFRGFYQGLYAV